MEFSWKAFFALTLTLYAHPALGACIQIPDNSDDPPVEICESLYWYEFSVGDEKRRYAKHVYHRQFRDALAGWFGREGVEAPGFWPARITLWVSAPEIDPTAAQGRFIVETPATRFIVFTSLYAEDWDFRREDMGIFDGGEYPQQFGFRAGRILAQAHSTPPSLRFLELLENHGAHGPTHSSGRWHGYDVPVFTEKNFRAEVLNDPRSEKVVDDVKLSPIFEWIAQRKEAFAFSLMRPED